MKNLALICLLFVGSIGFAIAQRIVLDPETTHQEMLGFGASDAWRTQFVGKNWPVVKREQMADLLFSMETDDQGNPAGIGLSLWRFCLGAGSTEQGDSSDIVNEWRRGECYLSPDGSYDWSKYEGQRWFLNAAKARGVEQFLAFSLTAPVQYSLNGKAYSIKGDERMNIKPGYYDDYAAYLAEVLYHYQENEGVTFDYISPGNEPQWDWSNPGQEGTAATNEDLYLLVRYLSAALESKKLNTKIVVGETGHLDHLYRPYKSSGNQVYTFFDPASPLYLGNVSLVEHTISGHSYFTTWPIDSLLETRESLAETLGHYPDLDFWQSEFCILEESPEIGNGHKRDLGMPTALYVARVIHSDIAIANATSWQWWTALTTFDYKDGLIYLDTGDPEDLFNRDRMKQDGDFHASKLLWALGNYSRFIRPGMQRIEAALKDVDDQTSISAYRQKDEGVLVLTNHSKESQRIALPDSFKASAGYLTDQAHSLAKVKIGKKYVQLPPKSLLTITGRIYE